MNLIAETRQQSDDKAVLMRRSGHVLKLLLGAFLVLTADHLTKMGS